MLSTLDLGCGITCIDTGYVRAQMTACYLMQQDGRAAFIETGVNHNVGGLLGILEQKGIAREQVDYVIPTHVHLDHAGGAGALMQALPNAQLVVHPLGVRHMINPAALIAGTSAVYGKEKFLQMYGEIIPVDPDRVIEAPDDHVVQLGARTLVFLDTPGHARHHFCIYDEKSQGMFSGDTFGLSYREFDVGDKVFCFPTTTPVQFDPEALQLSIKRIMSYQPEQIYLTHFGRIRHPADAADQLHEDIDQFVTFARQSSVSEQQEHDISRVLADYLSRRANSINPSLAPDKINALLKFDAQLNAQGLLHWLDRQ